MFLLELAGMFLLGIGVTVLVYAVRDFNRRIRQLEADKETLQHTGPKRVPYQTAEEIEDAMAGLIALREDLQIKSNILENIAAHLIKARNVGLKSSEEK